MLIGMTYDLRQEYLNLGYSEEVTAEFDSRDTIDALAQALREQGHETDFIGHVKCLTERLVRGERWDLVFNIAEGLQGFGRESLVPALLDAYEIPYTFSDPLVLAVTLHKATAKRVVRDLGLPTPDFYLVQEAADIKRVDLPLPMFVKPVAEGTGKGITKASKIISQRQLQVMCHEMLAKYHQPVLVERFLPGREFTVGILGTGKHAVPIGIMEVFLNRNAEPDVYSYINKEESERRVEYSIVDDPVARKAVEVALRAYQGLGCRDAGRVDLRADDVGIPNFIEINPLAGLHPEHSDLCIIANMAGINYRNLISSILDSAIERCIAKREKHVQNQGRYRIQPAGIPGPRKLGSLNRCS